MKDQNENIAWKIWEKHVQVRNEAESGKSQEKKYTG